MRMRKTPRLDYIQKPVPLNGWNAFPIDFQLAEKRLLLHVSSSSSAVWVPFSHLVNKALRRFWHPRILQVILWIWHAKLSLVRVQLGAPEADEHSASKREEVNRLRVFHHFLGIGDGHDLRRRIKWSACQRRISLTPFPLRDLGKTKVSKAYV